MKKRELIASFILVVCGASQAKAELLQEVSGNVKFYFETAASKNTTASDKDEADQSNIAASGMYGLIGENGFEPFLEAQVSTDTFLTGEYTSQIQKTSLGLGVLFNVPFSIGEPTKKSKGENSLTQATLIPYGGLMVGVDNESGTIKRQSMKEKTKDASVTTKFMVGVRTKVLENLYINTSVRASYQTVENKIDETSGKNTRLTIDVRLLGLSVIL